MTLFKFPKIKSDWSVSEFCSILFGGQFGINIWQYGSM